MAKKQTWIVTNSHPKKKPSATTAKVKTTRLKQIKIGTQRVHVSPAGESEMCYSLGTSDGDVTRLNVANVVRFSLYI